MGMQIETEFRWEIVLFRNFFRYKSKRSNMVIKNEQIHRFRFCCSRSVLNSNKRNQNEKKNQFLIKTNSTFLSAQEVVLINMVWIADCEI